MSAPPCQRPTVVIFACLWIPTVAALVCPELTRAPDVGTGALKHSDGLLWRIEDARGRVSHLYGTIHLADPRVTGNLGIVIDTLSASDSFTMEILLDMDAILELSGLMFFNDGRTLAGEVGGDLFSRTTERLAAYGISVTEATRMKPWAAYTTLSLPPGQVAMPLDLLLLASARQAGKPVFGLETLHEQAGVFDALSAADQKFLLLETVCNYAVFQRDIDKLIGSYVEGNLASLVRLSLQYESPITDRFLDAVVVQRNLRMVERMLPQLREGNAFIAIGALHLPGEHGVLELLERRGYKIDVVR